MYEPFGWTQMEECVLLSPMDTHKSDNTLLLPFALFFKDLLTSYLNFKKLKYTKKNLRISSKMKLKRKKSVIFI